MRLPRVGAVFHFGKEFDITIASGSSAKKLHIDPDLTLQIIANGEDGPLLKVINPIYFGLPISQFSNKLVLKMSFKDLIQMLKSKPS